MSALFLFLRDDAQTAAIQALFDKDTVKVMPRGKIVRDQCRAALVVGGSVESDDQGDFDAWVEGPVKTRLEAGGYDKLIVL